MRGAAFQARLHVVFQIAHDELSHSQFVILSIDITISYWTIGCKFKPVKEAVRGLHLSAA